jgi:hypothetical protein
MKNNNIKKIKTEKKGKNEVLWGLFKWGGWEKKEK